MKVDAQSILPSLSDERGGGWDLALTFHKGLQDSVNNQFGYSKSMKQETVVTDATGGSTSIEIEESVDVREHPIIHCMSHSRETIWSVAALYPNIHEYEQDNCIQCELQNNVNSYDSMYAVNLQQPVFRGSDDFWPNDPASHGPHLFANALNSLLLTNIGLQDWDAFQSILKTKGAATMHAVSRAISGGPVYCSDKRDNHDIEIITRLALAEGKVPRPLRNALPVERMLFEDPQRTFGVPLLVHNKVS